MPNPLAASVIARSPWPRAPLSGDCSFAHSNALLRAVSEDKALSEKDLVKHLDGKADGNLARIVSHGRPRAAAPACLPARVARVPEGGSYSISYQTHVHIHPTPCVCVPAIHQAYTRRHTPGLRRDTHTHHQEEGRRSDLAGRPSEERMASPKSITVVIGMWACPKKRARTVKTVSTKFYHTKATARVY